MHFHQAVQKQSHGLLGLPCEWSTAETQDRSCLCQHTRMQREKSSRPLDSKSLTSAHSKSFVPSKDGFSFDTFISDQTAFTFPLLYLVFSKWSPGIQLFSKAYFSQDWKPVGDTFSTFTVLTDSFNMNN